MATKEPYRGTRKEVKRAIRRLDILEWVILGAAAIVALLGGWLVAWLVRGLGIPFRLTWTIASVLLFAVPGVSVLAREAGGFSRLPIVREPTRDAVGGAGGKREGGTGSGEVPEPDGEAAPKGGGEG